ncbi:MAG: hypothetical protein RLZZ325_876 [Pseudomonadota bacterium]
MKGAQALIVSACLFEFDVLSNDINNIDPIEQIGDKGLRNERHGLKHYLARAALTNPDTIPISALPAN